MGIEAVQRTTDPRITRVERVGECRVRLRVRCECLVGQGSTEHRPRVVTSTCPGTRLLEPWELTPAGCTCPWCRWISIVAEQRRAREPRISSSERGQDVRVWPDSLWRFYERPDLRELPAAARRVIPLLMGPSWWLRPTVPRRLDYREARP